MSVRLTRFNIFQFHVIFKEGIRTLNLLEETQVSPVVTLGFAPKEAPDSMKLVLVSSWRFAVP